MVSSEGISWVFKALGLHGFFLITLCRLRAILGVARGGVPCVDADRSWNNQEVQSVLSLRGP